MLVGANISEYAQNVARDCDIDSACVFISDKTTPATKIYNLWSFGVSEEVLDRYYDYLICDSDPFLDVLLHENRRDASHTFHAANDPLLAKCGSRAEDYWRFVSHEGVEVVGATTMRLQPRLYLVIGTHRLSKRRARATVPVEQLACGLEMLQAKVASSLLSSLLAGGKGYRTLISVIDPQAANDDHRLAELSPRETEVARLVCEGRQNKEIAWLSNLSECTVENHLRHIYQKLGIHNRAALVARMNGVLS